MKGNRSRIVLALDAVGSSWPLNRDYDIFEKLPDGSPMWRDWVHGLENARTKLNLLASKSKHEFFALHTPTQEIVIRVNASDSKV